MASAFFCWDWYAPSPAQAVPPTPFGGGAFTIVLLISHTEPPWHVALQRFAEVSIGIAIALVLTVVWPETQAAPPEKAAPDLNLRHLSLQRLSVLHSARYLSLRRSPDRFSPH